jgi:hypothetical protein
MCKITPCINTDIYADGMCYYHYKYGSDTKEQGTERERKVAKPIPRESKKRAAENRVDQKQNKKILADNIYCQMKLEGCTGLAQGVQHIKGRTGQRLTDVANKIPACNNCNLRAETHPEEAKKKNVSQSRLKK